MINVHAATLEQLESAPVGSAIKDGDGDPATKQTDGTWAYFGDPAIAFSSALVHRTWSPIRLTLQDPEEAAK